MEEVPSWNVMTTVTIEKLDEVYMRVFADPSIEQELADFFTYEYPGARFTPQYKARLWDGKVRLYDQVRKTLQHILVNQCKESFLLDHTNELYRPTILLCIVE